MEKARTGKCSPAFTRHPADKLLSNFSRTARPRTRGEVFWKKFSFCARLSPTIAFLCWTFVASATPSSQCFLGGLVCGKCL